MRIITMDRIIDWISQFHPIQGALIIGITTWLLTALGASAIFLNKNMNTRLQDTLMGFTGGIMIAASVWSLIIPSLEMSKGEGLSRALPTIIGILLGALCLFIVNKSLPHFHNFRKKKEGPQTTLHRSTLMYLAITLHNIPEGLAIGVMFGGAAAGIPEASMSGAVLLGLAIGIQNIPEGMAVTIPLHRAGLSTRKSFLLGQSSAIVEPIAAAVGAAAVMFFSPVLPYALAFSAGAMIFVVVEDVIPESQQNNNTDLAVLGFIIGFVVMMTLDVGLG